MRAKYKNLCGAAYYGDLKMVKKLVEGDEEEEVGDSWREKVNVEDLLVTWEGVRKREFGVGFDVVEVKGDVFESVFKASGKSSEAATPLHWAVLGNEPDVVLYLLRKGAKTDVAKTPFAATPYHIAKDNKLCEIIKVFESPEAKILSQIEETRSTAKTNLETILETGCVANKTDVHLTAKQREDAVKKGRSLGDDDDDDTPPTVPSPAKAMKITMVTEDFEDDAVRGGNPLQDVIELLGEGGTLGETVVTLQELVKKEECGVEDIVGGLIGGRVGQGSEEVFCRRGIGAVVAACSEVTEEVKTLYFTPKEADEDVLEGLKKLKEGDRALSEQTLPCQTAPPGEEEFHLVFTTPRVFAHPLTSPHLPPYTHLTVTTTTPTSITFSTTHTTPIDITPSKTALELIHAYHETLQKVHELSMEREVLLNPHVEKVEEEQEEREEEGDE